MPEDLQNQTSESAAPEPFVELGAGDEPLAFDDEGQPTEASDAGDETPEPALADADEKPEMPSAESLGLDLSDPKQKAAYAELVKKHGQWTNRFLAKHKTKPEPEATPAATEAPAQADGEDPYASLYRVDFSKFKPDVKVREGSDLGEYAPEIVEIATSVAQQMMEHGLAAVYQNDRAFRENLSRQERERSVRDVVGAYAQEIQGHPEFEAKQAELAQLAQKYQSLAFTDPDEFVSLLERKTGIERGWRGAEQATQRDAGRANQRIADKRLSTVPRPSRPAATQSGGYASFDEEVAAKLRQMGR